MPPLGHEYTAIRAITGSGAGMAIFLCRDLLRPAVPPSFQQVRHGVGSRGPSWDRFKIRVMPDVLLARAFIEGLTEEAFEADLLRFYAVTRCLEIISEASRRLPSAIRDRHPELPWRAI